MKVHEQRDELRRAVETAMQHIPSAPTLGAFGIAREDCALVHMDYFLDMEYVGSVLSKALAEIDSRQSHEVWAHFGRPSTPCDCPACVGPERAFTARTKHRAAYTFVKEWHPSEASS